MTPPRRAIALALLASAALASGCGRPPVDRPASRSPVLDLGGARSLSVSAAVASSSVSPLGKEAVPVDLPTVLDLAGEKPNAVRLARERLAEAEARTNQGLAGALPTLALGSYFWRHQGIAQQIDGQFIEVTKQRLFLGALGLVSLDLVGGSFNYLGARRREASAEADVEVARQAKTLEAVEAYYDLVAAQAAIAIARDALDHAKGFQAVAASRERSKVGLRVDTLRADAQVASARHLVIQAEKRFYQESAKLANILRLDPTIVLYTAESAVRPITFIAAEKPVTDLVAAGLANRPDVRAQTLRVESADLEESAARYGPFVPTLYGGLGGPAAGLGGLGFEGENFGQLHSRGDWFVGFAWTLSGLGFGEWSRAQAASARLRAEQVQLDDQRERAEREIVQTYAAVRAESAGVDAAEDELKAADEARAITKKRLEEGTGIALDVLAAEEERTRAASRVVESIVGYNKAQYGLLIRVGDRPAR